MDPMGLEYQRVTEGFLFTDQYQLTMAQLYYRMGLHESTVNLTIFPQ
jgi:nicotinate phosphoribosyltransferase